MKKYLQFINENINNVNNFLLTNKDKYITEIDETLFNNILNEKCEVYSDISKNIKFYRGDRNLTGKYYILNAYNTIPKYQIQSAKMYPLTEFMSSHYWKEKNLPLKVSSSDIVSSIDITNMYGESYEVIPLDNPKIVCNSYLFGNTPPKRFIDEIEDTNFISMFFERLFSDLWLERYDKKRIYDYIKIVANEYNTKQFNPYNDDDNYIFYRDKILAGMEKHNMNFIEYMEYLFAPDGYEIYDYKNITNCKFKPIYGYTNGTLLLRKVK